MRSQSNYDSAFRFFEKYLNQYGQNSLFRQPVFEEARFQVHHEHQKPSGMRPFGLVMLLVAIGIGLMGLVLLAGFFSHLPQVLSLMALIFEPTTLSWLAGIATMVGLGSVFLMMLPHASGGMPRYGFPKRYFALMVSAALVLGFILSCGLTMGTFHTLSWSILMAQSPVFLAVNLAVLCTSLILVAWNTWGLSTKPGFETVSTATMAMSMIFMTVLAEAGLAAWMMHWIKAPSIMATVMHPGFMVPGLLMLVVSLVAVGFYVHANWHQRPGVVRAMMTKRQSLIRYFRSFKHSNKPRMQHWHGAFERKLAIDHKQRQNMVSVYKILITHAAMDQGNAGDILTKMKSLFLESNVHLWLGTAAEKAMRKMIMSDVAAAKKALTVLTKNTKFYQEHQRSIWLRHPLPFVGLALMMGLAVMLMMFDALPVMALLTAKTNFMVSTMAVSVGFGLVWTALVFAFSGIQALRMYRVNTMLHEAGMGTTTQPMQHLQALKRQLQDRYTHLVRQPHMHYQSLGHTLREDPIDLVAALNTLKYRANTESVVQRPSGSVSQDHGAPIRQVQQPAPLPPREQKALNGFLGHIRSGEHAQVKNILASKQLHEDMPLKTFFSSHFEDFFHYGVAYFSHSTYVAKDHNVCLDLLQSLEASNPERFAQLMAETKLAVKASWGRRRPTITGVHHGDEIMALHHAKYASRPLPKPQVETLLALGGHALLLSVGAYKKMTPSYHKHMDVTAKLSASDQTKVLEAWQVLQQETKSDVKRIKLLRYRTTFFKYAWHHAFIEAKEDVSGHVAQVKAMSRSMLSQLKYDQHFWAQNFDSLMHIVRPTLRLFSDATVQDATVQKVQRQVFNMRFDRIWQRRVTPFKAHVSIIKQLVKHDWQRVRLQLRLAPDAPLAQRLHQAFLAPKKKPVVQVSRKQPMHTQVTNALMGEDKSRTPEASQVLFYGFIALAGLMAATIMWLTMADRILLTATQPHTMLFLMHHFTFQCVAVGLLLTMAAVAIVMIAHAWTSNKDDAISSLSVAKSPSMSRPQAQQFRSAHEKEITISLEDFKEDDHLVTHFTRMRDGVDV